MRDLRAFYQGSQIGRLRVDSISGDRNGNITVMETYGLDDRRPTLAQPAEISPDAETSRKMLLADAFMKLPHHLGEIIDWSSENGCELVMEDVASKLISEVLVGTATEFTTASPLPAGTVSIGYSQDVAFTVTVGSGQIKFMSGSLPTGLSLSGATISGTPTVAGTYTFVLRLTDEAVPSLYVEKEYSITIAA